MIGEKRRVEFPHTSRIKRRLNIYPEGAGHLSIRLVAFYFGAVYLFNINAAGARAHALSHTLIRLADVVTSANNRTHATVCSRFGPWPNTNY